MPVFALSDTLPPEQKVVAPPALMEAVGVVVTITWVAEVVLLHPLLVMVAV